jgi:hypothetical protein
MEVYVDKDRPEYIMISGDYTNLLQSRITKAVYIATRHGMTDGAHHKQWVIDQMLRALFGDEKYNEWLDVTNSNPDYDPWDQGIAP